MVEKALIPVKKTNTKFADIWYTELEKSGFRGRT